jgi:hypothetical protein
MRTKLILGVAAIAASALTAVAQSNVYSLNVVGYINLPLVEGYNLVANQLDADGTGTNNSVATVLANVPVNTAVFKWTGAAYSVANYAKNKLGTATNWDNIITLNPGQGFWVQIPAGAGAQTVTTVGQVLQGTLVNPYLTTGGGYSLLSDQVPLAGTLQTNLAYVPQLNDAVFKWNSASQSYAVYNYAKNKLGTATNWDNGDPPIAVGEGFWLNSATAGATWNQTFNVQ